MVRGNTGTVPVTGLRAVLRTLRPLIGEGATGAANSAAVLERFAQASDPPKVAKCEPIETVGARLLASPSSTPDDGISAFLDGIQRSRVIGHVNGSPLIFATVGAAVRERVDRQLRTWASPRIKYLVLAARDQIGEPAWAALEAAEIATVDLESDEPHPLAVRARALARVGEERETLERRLAAQWCETESRWLWVDGGISGNLAIDSDAPAFGVIKSHTTLYGERDAIHATLHLPVGHRSHLFLIQHRSRRAVASWYVRLHASPSGDPLHGLVRVEVAPQSVHQLAVRADAISRWILAERAPVALPDPRWDTLTYGVYACEQFLKALIGP